MTLQGTLLRLRNILTTFPAFLTLRFGLMYYVVRPRSLFVRIWSRALSYELTITGQPSSAVPRATFQSH